MEKVNRDEYLIHTDEFWAGRIRTLDVVILANETGGITSVHKVRDPNEERLVPAMEGMLTCNYCGLAYKSLYQSSNDQETGQELFYCFWHHPATLGNESQV